MGYGYGTPAPRRSGRWLLPLVLGVLAVLVVGGGVYAASHLKTKAEAGAVPAGFTLYSDDAAHARIALPQDWTTEGTINGSKGLLATGPDGVGAIIVKSVNIAGDRVGGANGFITGAAGSGAVSNKTGPTDVTMAGETWTQEAADITRSGVTLHVVVLVAVHAEQTYILSYLATPRSLDDSNSKYFQPAIQSFAFTA